MTLALGPGRPSIYSDDLAHRIADLHAAGETFAQIGARDDMPDRATLWRWADREDFAPILARARKDRASLLAFQGLAIIDAVDPESSYGSARVSKAREQAAYRRWLAGSLDRDTFGERQKIDLDARVVTFTAFLDIRPREDDVPDSGTTCELPHVATVDVIRGE